MSLEQQFRDLFKEIDYDNTILPIELSIQEASARCCLDSNTADSEEELEAVLAAHQVCITQSIYKKIRATDYYPELAIGDAYYFLTKRFGEQPRALINDI